MSLLAFLRSFLGASIMPKVASPPASFMYVEDFSGPFTTTINSILDSLEEQFPEEHRSDALNKYIACCRLFVTGPIPYYPGWQVQKREYAIAIPSTPDMEGARHVAQMVSDLIDEVSYAAIEQDGLKEAERILQMVQTMKMGKD